jgi:hypothetical protein
VGNCGTVSLRNRKPLGSNAQNSGGLGAEPPERGSILCAWVRIGHGDGHEKKQLSGRLPPIFVREVLESFNAGAIGAGDAADQLGVGRTRLYELRTQYLRDRQAYGPRASGGAHRGAWPPDAVAFLEEFLPLQQPPNYQLVADELLRLHGFGRARSSVEAYAKSHFARLVPSAKRAPKTYRRFRRAFVGELWQHDSSIHQWWPAGDKQILLLSADDCSGLTLGGRFVPADTTWNHFGHFRALFEQWGIPLAIYTDALSLFGASSSHDHADPRSEFQRALRGLLVAHLVAPTPQAKGKIERRFQTFQGRMVALLAHAGAADYPAADEILQMEIQRQNATLLRSTGRVPMAIFEEQAAAKTCKLRPCPLPALLDLHFSLRLRRRVNNDHTVDFEGHNYEIAPTTKKFVSILHHPGRKFWVLEEPPTDVWPNVLGCYTL